MIVPIGSHTLAVPAIAAVGTRRPPPEEVQGVVIMPPRDGRVAVRVEIVTDHASQALPQPSAAELAPASYEAALYAANLETTAEATQLGATDLRRAAAAYSAHSEWRSGYGAGSGGARDAREPPRYLDVRA
jgi:hypothetical protein